MDAERRTTMYLPAIMGKRDLSRVFSRELPKYFTADEVRLILSEELRQKNYKAYFLCEFLWNTGLRVSEALSVRVRDIDIRARAMRVKTLKRKNHVRVLPLRPEFIGEVAVWINQFGLKRDDRLFRMNRQTAHYHVKLACEKAGIKDDRTHPHTLRHAFSINCILQGVPVTVLKEWLGHRDITKTLIYTNILAHDTRAFMENVRF